MTLTGYNMLGSLNIYVTRGKTSIRVMMRDTPKQCRAQLDVVIKQVYQASQLK